MDTRQKFFIRSSSVSAPIFINGSDVANSEFLYLMDHTFEIRTYTVEKYEHRLDLISKELYQDESYAWILQYINKVSLGDVVRGVTLKYIIKSDLNKLLSLL